MADGDYNFTHVLIERMQIQVNSFMVNGDMKYNHCPQQRGNEEVITTQNHLRKFEVPMQNIFVKRGQLNRNGKRQSYHMRIMIWF